MAFELLESVGSEQIQELQQDIRMLQEGYELLTVVDTFDICEYCFPFGIEFDKKVDKSMGSLGDEQFAYDFLFKKKYFGGKPIVIEEYKIELFNVKHKIYRLSERMLNRRNNLESEFIQPILKEPNAVKRKAMIGTLQNTLSFLISYALISETSVTRYSELLESGYLAEMRQTQDDLLRDVFDTANQEFVNQFKAVFEEWVRTRRDQIRTIADKADQLQELNSVYKDVTACVRVLIANNRYREAGIKKKVILHSSTPDRTDSIVTTSAFRDLQRDYGMADLSFVRNKSHTFLLSLVWEPSKEKDVEYGQVASRLAELLNIAMTYEQLQAVNDSFKKRSKGGLVANKSDQIITSARSAFEQSLLLTKLGEFGDYKSQIRELLDRLEQDQTAQYGSIIDLYNRFLVEAKSKAVVQSAELALENVKNVYTLQLNISTLVRGIIKAQQIKVTKGGDMIRGSFHHLPFLIFIHERNFDRKVKKILDPLISFCFQPERLRRFHTNNIIQVLGEFANFEGRTRETPSISLLSLFLMLLLPVAQNEKGGAPNGEGNEERALQNAERLLPIFEQLSEIGDPSAIDYFKELRYIIIWLYRRCRRYDESLALAEICVKLYRQDPRFYHGKCLTRYSMYLDNEEKQFAGVAEVDEVISIARHSMELYQKEDTTEEKINYTIVALLNTLAHLYCVRYRLIKDFEDLVQARKDFKDLRQYFGGERQPDIAEYPELLHTGAFLEYCCALEKKDTQKWEEAVILLDSAFDQIQAALALVPDSDLYEKLRKEIQEENRKIGNFVKKETRRAERK